MKSSSVDSSWPTGVPREMVLCRWRIRFSTCSGCHSSSARQLRRRRVPVVHPHQLTLGGVKLLEPLDDVNG